MRLASTLSESAEIKRGSGAPLKADSLIEFCVGSLLLLTHGFYKSSIMSRLQNTKSVFYASELIDWITEGSTFQSRDSIVNVAQQLSEYGVVRKVAAAPIKFEDPIKRLPI